MKNEKLKLARLRRKQTQAEAAAFIGVTVTTWNRWENGKSKTPKQKFYREALENFINS